MGKITYLDIKRRQYALNEAMDELVSRNADLYLSRINNQTPTYSNTLDFLEECAKNSKVSENMLIEIQRIINEVTEEDDRKELLAYTETAILPKCKMITIIKSPFAESWTEIRDHNNDLDRIIENGKLVSNKINIDKFIREHKIKDAKTVTALVTEAVGMFRSLPNIGKINVAIEQAVINCQKYEIPYEEATIIDWVGNVFSLGEAKRDPEYNKELCASLLENSVVDFDKNKSSMSEVARVYLYEDSSTLHPIINQCVDGKRINLSEFFSLAEAEIANNSVKDIFIDYNVLKGGIPYIADRIVENYIDNSAFTKYIDKAVAQLREEANFANQCAKFPTDKGESIDSTPQRYRRYGYTLEAVANILEGYKDIVYPQNNLKTITESLAFKSKGVISLGNAANKIESIANNILKSRTWIKGKAIVKSVGDKVTTVLKTSGSKPKLLRLFKGSKEVNLESVIYEYTTPEGVIDFVFDRFLVEDGVDKEVINYMDQLCGEINQSVLHSSSTGNSCYFTALENMIELHYVDHDMVEIDEEAYSEYFDHYLDESYMPFVYEMMRYSVMDESSIPTVNEVSDYFIKYNGTAMDDFDDFLELASYATLDKDFVQEVFKEVCEFSNSDFKTKYMYRVETYEPNTEITPDAVLESIDLLGDIIHEKKVDYNERYGNLDDDEKDSEEEEKPVEKKKPTKKEKAPEKGKDMNFNGVKLFLLGLKDKMKKLSSKEQALCRNMDNSYERLVKSMKNALISDRREAIIKGSVIPSLSKSIKVGVALAGTAIINPLAPIIAAIGAFGVSKHLTKKERVLLLDDIEIELKIIEKEIQNAESDNNMKKMRVLMREQRNLQRQYQRIKYNIRVGKDIIPGRAGGDD